MASTSLVPLAMSQTKEDLLRHLNMSSATYILMAREADRVYKWLTSDTRRLKNCKRKPPYNWSDIVEKSKDEAMIRICQSSGQHTAHYWNLAVPMEDCPNWIARWFLYHKFRYRDRRNRNPARGDDGKHRGSTRRSKHSKCKEKKHIEHDVIVYNQNNHYPPYYSTTESMISSPIFPEYRYPLTGSLIKYSSYSSSATDTSVPSRKTSYSGGEDKDNTVWTANRYYDPVRDL